ncbi:MAG: EAL domain-containing protein [Ectothiorhodospiraceae bacterium]|nr:EAL domain-containing protein [Ectothiorhodospiraceae bacterium]
MPEQTTSDKQSARVARAREERRLSALRELNLLNTLPERAFDQVAALAALSFNIPFAGIGFIDDQRQWFKACAGKQVRAIPRKIMLCQASLDDDGPVVIRDAASDPRSRSNPLVTGPTAVRFHASAPLRASGGDIIGTLCIVDTEPRPDFGAPEVEQLRLLADLAMDAIRAREAEKALPVDLDDPGAVSRLEEHFSNSPLGVAEWDQDFRLVRWSPQCERIFGWRAEEVLGRCPDEWRFLVEEDAPAVAEVMGRMLRGEINRCTHRNRNYTREGRMVECEWYNSVIRDERGQLVSMFTQVHDISAQVAMRAALHKEKELAQITLESIGEAVVRTDIAGRIEYMNGVAKSLVPDAFPGQESSRFVELFRLYEEQTGQPLADPVQLCLDSGEAVSPPGHYVLIREDGAVYSVTLAAEPVRNRQGVVMGAVVTLTDVTEQRRMYQRMAYLASHDPLTGLYNRREFETRLGELLERPSAEGEAHHALLYMDLDQFKVVNDSCGHPAGDELLQRLTVVLSGQLEPRHTLARLGGDEFGVLLRGVELEEATSVANALIDAVRGFRFSWEGNVYVPGMSIGLVPVRSGSQQVVSELLSAADSACYAAKEQGRNRVQRVGADEADGGIMMRRREQVAWVGRINRAVEEDRLVLFRQGIHSLCDINRPPLHHEVLLRMRGENGELVPPGVFIPAAETYNLMPRLDRLVLANVFAALADGGEVGDCEGFYSINISGTTLSDNEFPDFVRRAFHHYGVRPSRVCFEITETATITNLGQAVEFFSEIRELGSRVALDDFGSGLSSFGYLRRIPIDYLKIDGQFVQTLLSDEVNQAVVESIHRVATAMGIRTIAEFVEDHALAARLREMGIDYGQGYGLHKPEFWLNAVSRP